jgi:signal transduction histidine kinase
VWLLLGRGHRRALLAVAVASWPTTADAGQPVRVGVHEAPPFVSTDTNGQPTGFAIDVLEGIALQENWDLEYVRGSWQEQTDRLRASEIDLLMPVSRTPERAAEFRLGRESLISTWGQVFAPAGETFETVLQLDDHRVATVRGDSFGSEFVKLADRFDVTVTVVEASNVSEAFSFVRAGRADVATVERLDGSHRAANYDLGPTPIIFHPTAARFAASPHDTSLLAVIDETLQREKTDASSNYSRAFDRWFGSATAGENWPAWMTGAFIGVLTALLAALLLLWTWRSRLQRATSKLREQNTKLRKEVRDRERVEGQLRQAQKMEAVGQLASGIAHDFNNLLMIVQAYIEALAASSDAETSRAAREIKLATHRAGRLTRQLLAFGRKQTLQPRVVGVDDLLNGAVGLLRKGLRDDISLSLDLVANVPPVEVDPAQIEQVLLNLVVNARDAMPEGGHVTISTGTLELERPRGPLKPGTYAELRIEDTGLGIGASDLERVFEPFFTTKEKAGGSGLGLAVAYGIVRQSGGDIQIKSDPGVGTTFTVLLPATAASSTHEFAPADETNPTHGMSRLARAVVLLIDDDAGVRAALRAVLERRGIQVLSADGATRALELAESHKDLDIIITDVVMPGLRGPELAARLREMGVAAPVLYVSGYSADDLGDFGIVDPAVHLLQKPFSPVELIDRVIEILGLPNATARNFPPRKSGSSHAHNSR